MAIKDGNWELMQYEPALKRSLWSYFDGQKTHYRHTYEVDDILDVNRTEYNENHGKRFGEWRKVASIPSGIFFDSLGTAAQNRDQAYINRFLNDSDNRAFRTFAGNI